MVRAVSCFSHMFISRRTIKVVTIVSPTVTIVSKISRIMIQSSIETENSLILYKNWGFVELHKYFLFLMYEIIFKVPSEVLVIPNHISLSASTLENFSFNKSYWLLFEMIAGTSPHWHWLGRLEKVLVPLKTALFQTSESKNNENLRMTSKCLI